MALPNRTSNDAPDPLQVSQALPRQASHEIERTEFSGNNVISARVVAAALSLARFREMLRRVVNGGLLHGPSTGPPVLRSRPNKQLVPASRQRAEISVAPETREDLQRSKTLS